MSSWTLQFCAGHWPPRQSSTVPMVPDNELPYFDSLFPFLYRTRCCQRASLEDKGLQQQ